MKLLALSLAAFVSCAALGCSSQPVAPSALPTTAPTTAVAAASTADEVATTRAGGRAGTIGVVYVTSQGLYYDTFVTVDPLPFHGKFQKIENGATMYGPGQPGYLGGRWWEDSNGNGLQDPTDHYFLCPLLPPGRPTP
jgi:hypothetical protein